MHTFFEKHIIRHYLYLHDTHSSLVPKLELSNVNEVLLSLNVSNEGTNLSHSFLLNTFERVRNVICCEETNIIAHNAILEHSVRY